MPCYIATALRNILSEVLALTMSNIIAVVLLAGTSWRAMGLEAVARISLAAVVTSCRNASECCGCICVAFA
jgi:hypothetical protein